MASASRFGQFAIDTPAAVGLVFENPVGIAIQDPRLSVDSQVSTMNLGVIAEEFRPLAWSARMRFLGHAARSRGVQASQGAVLGWILRLRCASRRMTGLALRVTRPGMGLALPRSAVGWRLASRATCAGRVAPTTCHPARSRRIHASRGIHPDPRLACEALAHPMSL